MRILIFGGTTEGRTLAEKLKEHGEDVTVCVATENGEEELSHLSGIAVKTGRLSREEISALLTDYAFCIDATHPYALQISRTVKDCCMKKSIPYRRILRKTAHVKEARYFADASEAAAFLKDTEGNVLLTIGTRQLSSFDCLERNRIYARILPMPESLDMCREAGLKSRQVIAMQGPFSVEMNEAIIRHYDIRYLVTKDGGREGGFPEKAQAAAACHIPLLVIERPVEEEGLSVEELWKELYGKNSTAEGRVFLVGCGCGREGMTDGARKALAQADLLIGAGRLLEEMQAYRGRKLEIVRPEETLHCIEENRDQCIAVLFSGDTGFYSGAAKLIHLLQKEGIKADVIPGISSVQYFAARLGRPWQDWNLCSVHGKEIDLQTELKKGKPLFLLTGGGESIRNICAELTGQGLGDTPVYVGEALSYPEERIVSGPAREMMEESFRALNVILIEIPFTEGSQQEQLLVEKAGQEKERLHCQRKRAAGIPDEAFIRGNVPMTKQEIRAVILAKLSPGPDDVCWDIGAGTGSVSVELAMAAGQVWAVECQEEACRLIRENRERFGLHNLELAAGRAPDILSSLPRPDVVFIGGSGGELAGILESVRAANPALRLCISAITIETAAAALAWMKENHMEAEITQIAVSRGKKAGDSHLLSANNPVFLLTGKQI